MKKNTAYLILNSITLIFALMMNYLSGTSYFGTRNVGEVSAMFQNNFTPAGYAFAIWGVIYLWLIAFVVYLWLTGNEHKQIKQIGLWFALSNVVNGLWIFAWLNLHIGISVVFMLILLASLTAITLRMRIALWDAKLRIRAFTWWPIGIYLGWIIVATVANISAWLVSLGWYGGFLSPTTWSMVMIAVAAIIYLLLIQYRNMSTPALVGIWALVAIAERQWLSKPEIAWTALATSAILLIAVGINAFYKRTPSHA